MRTIFVIGLFKSLRKKFESDCANGGLNGRYVLAEKGRKGTYDLVPTGHDAKNSLSAYSDNLTSYNEGYVIVLPYTDIPQPLRAELDTLSEMGCRVVYATNGADGWPLLKKRQSPDTATINRISSRLLAALPIITSARPTSVSDYFRAATEANPQIIIAEYVYDTCDTASATRLDFFKASIDAFAEFVNTGSGGRIDAFFQKKGIEHAQTGGISTTLKVFFNDLALHNEVSSAHLKKGDKTTPEAAARIYYQLFSVQEKIYVAILYAGPHPDRDVTCTLTFS